MSESTIFLDVNEMYGRYMWAIANRYAAYTLTPHDIFHEILLLLHNKINAKELSLGDEAKIHSLIISRSIDLLRRELRHFDQQRWERGPFDVSTDRRTGRSSYDPSRELDDKELRNAIIRRVPNELDARIICEIIWPCERTVDMARHDAEEAFHDSKTTCHVRMNASDPINPTVQKRHVARSLGVSPSRVTTALHRAAKIIHELLGE